MRIATDVGGTFTDLVYLDVDEHGKILGIKTCKSDTTPPNFEEGVFNTINDAKIDISKAKFFAHGTTVVINAITERKGVKTGFITTKGFRDSLEIARGDRPDFFNLKYRKPKTFIPRFLRKEIIGRMDFRGNEMIPLDLSNLNSIINEFKNENVQSIAICLLHSYSNQNHEISVRNEIKKLWPEVSIVISSDITREWREYERGNTAVLCAYIKPIAEKYLDRLYKKLNESKFSSIPYIMQSNGGIDSFESTKNTPITMIESGPTSGVIGAAKLGEMIGENNIIALDIGGTTAKCSLIENGNVKINTNYWIEKNNVSSGYPVMVPVVDIVEIGNGGGSIAWVDDYGKLHVGPQSAGAVPGPVAYGKGGKLITTTDANLLTGRINPHYFCGGKINADMDSINIHIKNLSDKLGLSKIDIARGVIRIANNNMINALKLISVNKGYDPRDFTLVAFGGGGGMHASALAQELYIPKVIVPNNSAVFSAWGMLMSDMRRDYIQTKLLTIDDNAIDDLNNTFEKMENTSLEKLKEEKLDNSKISFKRYGSFRYLGQDHYVEISLESKKYDKDSIKKIIQDFNKQYEKEYTYKLDSQVDMIQFHLVVNVEIDKPPLQKKMSSNKKIEDAIKSKREVDFAENGVHQSNIYDFNKLEPGMKFNGPAIVEDPSTTIVILPKQECFLDEFSNLHINIVPSFEK